MRTTRQFTCDPKNKKSYVYKIRVLFLTSSTNRLRSGDHGLGIASVEHVNSMTVPVPLSYDHFLSHIGPTSPLKMCCCCCC